MKKKTIFTALATTLSVAILGGSLVVPTFAARSNWLYCQYCHEAFWIVDINNTEKLDTHEKDCEKNPANIYGTCQYCGLEISNVMDTYMYGKLPIHETRCDKNPNRTYSAESSAKEEIEIFIQLPCQYCEEFFYDVDAHEKECLKNPANKKTETPVTPEVTENKETPDTPEVTENKETPDTPEVTENKETPDTPEVTENKETPDTPEVTENKETPDTPEVTENKETPDKPEVTENTKNEDESGVSAHAESSAKEEVEIEIPELPCEFCGELIPSEELIEHEKICPENPENKKPETPETPDIPEVPETPETPDTPEVPEEPEQPKEPIITITTLDGHSASAKEEIELTIEF